MNIDLAEIIQTGGPVGFALLFAWLWMQERADRKDSEDKRFEEFKEMLTKMDLNTAALSKLSDMVSIIVNRGNRDV